MPTRKEAIQAVTEEFDVFDMYIQCIELEPTDFVLVAAGDIVETKSVILSSTMN